MWQTLARVPGPWGGWHLRAKRVDAADILNAAVAAGWINESGGFRDDVAETPKPAPTPRAWPRGIPVAALAVFVLLQIATWGLGFAYLFLNDLELAGLLLTGALALFLVFSWAWRWAVAAGFIGGRPTARFGGT